MGDIHEVAGVLEQLLRMEFEEGLYEELHDNGRWIEMEMRKLHLEDEKYWMPQKSRLAKLLH